MRRRDFCAGLLAAPAVITAARADTAYPNRPVRLVVPFPPGGSNDIIGRIIAQQLSERLGKQVVVENRGGAGGTIGTQIVATAPPDGHTLLMISTAYAFNTSLYKQLPYDPAKSFVPVALLGNGPFALAVYPGLPVNSVAELMALAKQKPGELTFASAGVGSGQHLTGELFRLQAGINVIHVPYKGGGPAQADVVAGHAQIIMGTVIQSIPLIKSGQLKALAVTSAKRSPLLPDVPAVAETIPGFEAANLWGIIAPAATPPDIVERLHREITAVLTSAETRKRFDTEGADAILMSSADFGKLIQDETAKWARVVKEANIQAE